MKNIIKYWIKKYYRITDFPFNIGKINKRNILTHARFIEFTIYLSAILISLKHNKIFRNMVRLREDIFKLTPIYKQIERKKEKIFRILPANIVAVTGMQVRSPLYLSADRCQRRVDN